MLVVQAVRSSGKIITHGIEKETKIKLEYKRYKRHNERKLSKSYKHQQGGESIILLIKVEMHQLHIFRYLDLHSGLWVRLLQKKVDKALSKCMGKLNNSEIFVQMDEKNQGTIHDTIIVLQCEEINNQSNSPRQ